MYTFGSGRFSDNVSRSGSVCGRAAEDSPRRKYQTSLASAVFFLAWSNRETKSLDGCWEIGVDGGSAAGGAFVGPTPGIAGTATPEFAAVASLRARFRAVVPV